MPGKLSSIALSLLVALTGCTPPVQATAGRATGSPAQRVVVPATEPREQTADQQVRHALTGLGFGPRPGDVARVRAMGVDGGSRCSSRPSAIDDRTMRLDRRRRTRRTRCRPREIVALVAGRDSRRSGSSARAGRAAGRHHGRAARRCAPSRSARLRSCASSFAETRRSRRRRAGGQAGARGRERAAARGGDGGLLGEPLLRVRRQGADTRYYVPEYDRDVIRPHALGNFRDLLGAVAKSPAMLFYLDSARARSTRRTAPLTQRAACRAVRTAASRARTERELRARAARAAHARRRRRLHAAGRHRGRARAHRLDDEPARRAPSSSSAREIHDAGREDRARPPARRRAAASRTASRCSTSLARHPATARFIARKLAVRFVSDDAAAGARRARRARRSARPTATSARPCARSSRARSSSAARRTAPR